MYRLMEIRPGGLGMEHIGDLKRAKTKQVMSYIVLWKEKSIIME